jgi:hypothetical protein
MRLAALLLWGAALAQAAPFRLEPGEYRWLQFKVRTIPTVVDCKYKVTSGRGTVHMEVLTMPEFRRYYRGQPHETFAESQRGPQGEIRQMVDERGDFAVLVKNDDHAPMVMVDLEVGTDSDPSAQVLPPERRLAVILISFGIFFAIVTVSGWRLWRAANSEKE